MGFSEQISLDLGRIEYRDFGETITYVKSDGVERSITALVNRQPAAPMPEILGVLRPLIHVTVQNSATLGIGAIELDTATDSLKFARRIGGSVESFAICKILAHDGAEMRLEVR